MPAAGALQQRCPHRPRFVVPASRTTKTLRPAELTQILSTGLLGGETRLELGQIPRIIFHFPDPTSCGHLSQVNTHLFGFSVLQRKRSHYEAQPNSETRIGSGVLSRSDDPARPRPARGILRGESDRFLRRSLAGGRRRRCGFRRLPLSLQCNRGQGFLFSRPAPADVLTTSLLKLPKPHPQNRPASRDLLVAERPQPKSGSEPIGQRRGLGVGYALLYPGHKQNVSVGCGTFADCAEPPGGFN